MDVAFDIKKYSDTKWFDDNPPSEAVERYVSEVQQLVREKNFDEVVVVLVSRKDSAQQDQYGFYIGSNNIYQYCDAMVSIYGDLPQLGYFECVEQFSSTEERDHWVSTSKVFLDERNILYQCELEEKACTFSFNRRSRRNTYWIACVEGLFLQKDIPTRPNTDKVSGVGFDLQSWRTPTPYTKGN